MSKRFPTCVQPGRSTALALFLLVGLLAPIARAEFPTTRPFPAVNYHFEERKTPPNHLHSITIDLADPAVNIRVSPAGPDPDGAEKFQTTLMKPTDIATREKFDIVVNGDFFATKNNAGPGEYREGQWATIKGPAVTDGKLWSTSPAKRPCLAFFHAGNPSIEDMDTPPADATQVIAGNVWLVRGGKTVRNPGPDRHPRTVVGLDEAAKKLTVLIVDGRWAGNAVGMTYTELSAEMVRLGCHSAINLDGGGSTVLVMRDSESKKLVIVNHPSDGKERAVANVLGVTMKGKK